jgi:hypothetical protein
MKYFILLMPLILSTLMNNWTEEKIKKLNEWVHLSQVYSACHIQAYEYYSQQFNRITIVVVFLGALAAVLEGTNLLLSSRNLGLGVSVVILTSIVSGLNLLLNSKNPAEAGSAHESMSKGYNRIILKIESELSNAEPERENGVKFIGDIRNNLADLSTGGKSIPSWIWTKVNNDLKTVNTKPRRISTKSSDTSASDSNSAPTSKPADSSTSNSTPTAPSPSPTETTLEVNLFDPSALKVVDLLTKYQTARYRSAY